MLRLNMKKHEKLLKMSPSYSQKKTKRCIESFSLLEACWPLHPVMAVMLGLHQGKNLVRMNAVSLAF
ncbi:hypothetical protein J616_04164 [Acinetobacter baumannii 1457504]|nr:hypothetical protein J616_04164 [Acinetobacter baumannii 1457504]